MAHATMSRLTGHQAASAGGSACLAAALAIEFQVIGMDQHSGFLSFDLFVVICLDVVVE